MTRSDHEAARLAALRSYEILDTPPEDAFDDLTRLAAQVCGTPIAAIGFLDESRQWLKSKVGQEITETPREFSFCEHVVRRGELMVVEDVSADAQFAGNPMVLGDPHIRFYAGTPLIDHEGFGLGVFCVIDRVPRQLAPEQAETLRILSRQVMIQLEARRNSVELSRALSEQQRIQEALKDSDAFYQSLVEGIPQNLFRKDAQGRYTFANHRFCATLGKSPEEIVGQTDFDFFPAELAQKFHRDDRRVMESRRALDIIEAHNFPGGNKIFAHIVKTPILDAEGKAIGIQGVFWDVSERKRIEEALAHERELMRTLINNVPDYIYFKDAQSRFLKINLPLSRRFNLGDPSEAMGKTDFDFFTEEHARLAFEDEQAIMRTGQPIIGKIEKETWPDGMQTWAFTSKMPLRNKSGEIIGTFGISKDITDLKNAEDQLAYQRDLLQALLDNVPDSIYFKDLESRFLVGSKALANRLGLSSPEQIAGKNDFDFHPEHQAQGFYRDEQEIIRTGRPIIGKTEMETLPDGSVTWALTTKMPLRNKDGKIIGTIGVAKDITSLKQTEAELQLARDAALESARLKSEFLANMSHEIRTPMNAIIGMTDLLLETELTAEQRDFAETTRGSVNALLTVINDILDFSKIEAGKLTFETIDFDLLTVVEGAVELLASRSQAKGIELISWLHPETPTRLRGDPSRLRQVLVNLLSNAVKFTDQGEVVLRVSKIRETAAQVVIRFSVTDTGIGIPDALRPRLFQPFMQADGSLTRRYGGTGLGLVISKHLVELMNGRIGFESEAGHGSTFWFTAHLGKQSERAEVTEGASLAGLRALIVADNATHRRILSRQLAAWGMKDNQAAGAEDALRILRHEGVAGCPYDLVILDQQMPSMDGLALARIIKDDPAIATVQLVMLTSLRQHLEPEDLKSVGIAACLVKPVKQSRLYDCLAMVLGGGENAASENAKPTPALPTRPLNDTAGHKDINILLAEDNPVNQKVALSQLQKLGYSADAVPNGRKVLEALDRARYDVVLMDSQMPQMDGYEATRRIREKEAADPATPKRSPIYVIALTANALQGDREKCLDAGMNDYVSKPVHLADLQAALQRAVKVCASRQTTSENDASGCIIDPEALASLRDLRRPGQPDPLLELIDLFLRDGEGRLRQMADSLAQRNTVALAATAHSLKGSASNLGSQRLAALCLELEQLTKAGKWSEAGSKWGEVQEAFRCLRQVLEAEKQAPDGLAS
ncbi:MAG: PAS domain-containing protein [Candidatus Omnitrophica bacterium]|nr:PAS domain-containing protein [Candidatus Omnitrophota bacterium]